MKTPSNPAPEQALAGDAQAAEPKLVLLKQHRHAGTQYFAGHEFTQAEWGLTDREMGFLQAHGVI